MAVRIVVADDHLLIRRELRRLLETEDGWAVCGEAENGKEAVRLCNTKRPDAVTLDINMPLMGGLEAAAHIRQVAPTVAVVIISVHVSDLLIAAALEAGARGYIVKSEAPDHLVPAIRTLVGTSETYLRRSAPSKMAKAM
jgi:DNA-binding NarL/FixJ family response regulator